jgi:hypothetical protein
MRDGIELSLLLLFQIGCASFATNVFLLSYFAPKSQHVIAALCALLIVKNKLYLEK